MPVVETLVEVHGQAVECATCGAAGTLSVVDGAAVITLEDPDHRSVTTLEEKRAHFRHPQRVARAAADVEQLGRRSRAHFRQYRLEQRPVARFRELGPIAGAPAPVLRTH